ncbi:MAG: alpha-hydroxy-acid oxidizing protein, partial [Actinobacteria bacterium]|nr:alpha-hydroxy-acid oxidizing protein [Actinomycetota bacterium]
AGGAGLELTVAANRAAFERRQLVPRILCDVGDRELGVELFGTRLPSPLLLSPIGANGLLHPDGERGVTLAATAAGVLPISAITASITMEEVAAAAGAGPRWFQLYWPNDPELAASLLRRAERAGYGAIVVTLDTPVLGWRPRDLDTGYTPFVRGIGLANYLEDPVFRSRLSRPPEVDPEAAVRHWAQTYSSTTLGWGDLGTLREQTSLPIVIKGVLHPDDAREAAAHGADGVIVSNHGGRQVDGAIAALDALPAVRAAVPTELPVLLDSGVRSGADALKAIALGADAVCVGRPYLWALALGGEAGVRQVLRGLLAELELTMSLCGCPSPAAASPDLLTDPQPPAPARGEEMR